MRGRGGGRGFGVVRIWEGGKDAGVEGFGVVRIVVEDGVGIRDFPPFSCVCGLFGMEAVRCVGWDGRGCWCGTGWEGVGWNGMGWENFSLSLLLLLLSRAN